jgi:probable phosphoglycerate mutase
MALILLVRHGQNDWVNKKRLAGWLPGVHLNEEGRKQAEQLADRLAHLPVKAVYSSPLERCQETAAMVAKKFDLTVQECEAVGEVRYGKWEGKKLKKLAKKKRKWYAVQHYPGRFRFPGGESFIEVQQRAVSALESLSDQHEKEMIVVVSHADVIKLVLAHYMGIHIDLFQRIAVSPIGVSALALDKGGRVHVLRVNDSGPLQAPPVNGGKKEGEGHQASLMHGEDNEREGLHSADNNPHEKVDMAEIAKSTPTHVAKEKD